MTFGDKVIKFNDSLELHEHLPQGIHVMNPFKTSKYALEVSARFYKKFYNDYKNRTMILGINPGRFGAGATGVPFTDTKRLEEKCGIPVKEIKTHEPSSVFMYDMIDEFGGVEKFYNQLYISSVCPLGFVKTNNKGKDVNYNYYDSKELQELVTPFIVDSIKTQIGFGIKQDVCYSIGSGKNLKFLTKLNEKYRFFEKIIPLEHPRYVMQYKLKSKKEYIKKYIDLFENK